MILGTWASHRDTSMRLVELMAVPSDSLPGRLRALGELAGVQEAFILSTCNRVESYLVLDRPVGEPDEAGIAGVVGAAWGVLGAPPGSMVVETDARAVRHLLAVVCGLESMVLGEHQIVAQTREATRVAGQERTLGPRLHALLRLALRTGKRARASTAIRTASQSMVSVGLDLAAARLGGLTGLRGLLIGAGKLGALAGPLMRAEGVGPIEVANRTLGSAQALANRIGGTAVGLMDLIPALGAADLVVSSTGAGSHVVTAEQIALAQRSRPGRPLVVLDLALPRDIAPEAREVSGVTIIDISDIGAHVRESDVSDNIAAVWSMVDEAVWEYQRWENERWVAPAIGAMRDAAGRVAESEVRRLFRRLPELDDRSRREAEATVWRIVHKLLHQPTVRARQLASEPGGRGHLDAVAGPFSPGGTWGSPQ